MVGWWVLLLHVWLPPPVAVQPPLLSPTVLAAGHWWCPFPEVLGLLGVLGVLLPPSPLAGASSMVTLCRRSSRRDVQACEW